MSYSYRRPHAGNLITVMKRDDEGVPISSETFYFAQILQREIEAIESLAYIQAVKSNAIEMELPGFDGIYQ